jgi:hypothetical protein
MASRLPLSWLMSSRIRSSLILVICGLVRTNPAPSEDCRTYHIPGLSLSNVMTQNETFPMWKGSPSLTLVALSVVWPFALIIDLLIMNVCVSDFVIDLCACRVMRKAKEL